MSPLVIIPEWYRRKAGGGRGGGETREH
jgi:hypothetical protein